MKKQGFIQGSLILISSAAVSKIIGAVFRIPLANLLGGTGMGYFSSAYGIFMSIYAVSVTGLPVAAAKLSAECCAIGKKCCLAKIRRVSAVFYFITGLFFTLLMLALAVPFCILAGDGAEALPSVILIAPSLLFGCLAAAYRGCFEGTGNMLPTALSQVLEATIKLISGIFLCAGVFFVYRKNPQTIISLLDNCSRFVPMLKKISPENAVMSLAAAAAVSGVTISTFAGLIIVMIRSAFEPKYICSANSNKNEIYSTKFIVDKLTAVIIPAAAGSLITNLTSLIDLTTIINSLKKASEAAPEFFADIIASGIDVNELPNFIFGSFTGLAVTIFNLIPSFTNMLGKGIIPGAAGAFASGSKEKLRNCAQNVIFTSAYIAVPAGMGISALSGEILRLLFPTRAIETEICVVPLKILGFAVIFLSVSSVIFSLLQASGKAEVPVKIMLCGVAVKLAGNIALVRIPAVNVSGAAVSTLICYAAVFVMSVAAAEKYAGIPIKEVYLLFVKLFFSSGLCAVTAVISYNFLENTSHNRLVLFPAVAFGALIYIISTYLTGILSKSTLKLLIY